MARAVVGNPFENQIPTVSPTAQPVDIYQRGVVKSSPFASLAENLSRLSQKADRAFGNVEKRAAEREFAEGQELYNKTRLAIGDAVREGIIDEGESPYLRKGYRVSQLNVLANKYATDLNVALEAQQLYKNGNPAAAEKFSQDFYNKFVEANDLSGFAPTELAEFLTPTTQKANAAFISSWKTKNISWQREQNYIQFGQEIGAYTDSLYDSGDITPEKMKSFTDWIQSKVDGAEVNGMDRQKVNKALVDAVLVTAEENDDVDLLTILDEIKVGTGTLGSSISVRNSVMASESRIARSRQAEDVRISREEKEARDRLQAQLETEAFEAADSAFKGDPDAQDNFEAVLVKMVENNLGTEAKTFRQFFNAMKKEGASEDLPAAVAELFENVNNAESSSDLMALLSQGIEDKEITFNTAMQAIGKFKQRVDKEGKLQKFDYNDSNSPVKQIFDQFIGVVTETDDAGMFVTNKALVMRARFAIEQEYDEWKAGIEGPVTREMMRDKAKQIIQSNMEIYVSQEKVTEADNALEAIRVSRDPDEQPVVEDDTKPEDDESRIDKLINLFNRLFEPTAPLPKKIN